MLDGRQLCFFSTYLNINVEILTLLSHTAFEVIIILSSLQAKSLTTSSCSYSSSHSSSYCLWNPKSTPGSCPLSSLSLPKAGPQPEPLPCSLGSASPMSLCPPSVYPLGTAGRTDVGSCSPGNRRSAAFALGSVQEFASLLHRITTRTWQTCCGYNCCTAVGCMWALPCRLL